LIGNWLVSEIAVVNASPLIFLSRGSHLDLLSCFFPTVLIPRRVAEEIEARGAEDVAARALRETKWLMVADVESIPPVVAVWGLGQGESAVIALALSRPGAEVVMDDLAGRKCVLSLGLPVRGTLGIVLLAKMRGIIPAARPVIEELLRSGMYLSRHVVDEALSRVDE
jgi:predicted nucleic acid-binding protein